MLTSHACMHMCTHAGHKVRPHLILRHSMELPERLHLGKESKNSIIAIVFINWKHGMFVKLLTGSRVPHADAAMQKMLPTCVYTTKAGAPAQRMTGKEYEDSCTEAVQHFTVSARSERERAAMVNKLMLVHDRSTCHTRSEMDVCVPGATLTTVTAPPRSPDLMPLDFAVFGCVKRQVLNAMQHDWTWAKRAKHFVDTLQSFKPQACIESYPLRLQECYETGGQRVKGGSK